MGNQSWDAIVFDQDGVLTPTRTLNHELELAICKEVGIVIDPTAWKKFDGGRPYDTFRMIIDDAGRADLTPEGLLERKFALFEERLLTMELISGSREFLGLCRAHTAILALATSNTCAVRDAVASKFKLAPLFNVTVDGDSGFTAEQGKYAFTWDSILDHARERGLTPSPSRTLVIDDGHYGVRQAKRLGWIAWGFAEDNEQEGLLIEAGADKVFRTFASMQKAFLA